MKLKGEEKGAKKASGAAVKLVNNTRDKKAKRRKGKWLDRELSLGFENPSNKKTGVGRGEKEGDIG